MPGRRFDLSFYPKFLRKALAREREQATLMAWSSPTLPPLPIGHRQQWEIPVPLPSGKVGSVRVDVAVLERTCESSAVWVSGYSPATPQRLRPAVRQALGAQLPKLEAAPAVGRVLLLEVPAMRGKSATWWANWRTVFLCSRASMTSSSPIPGPR